MRKGERRPGEAGPSSLCEPRQGRALQEVKLSPKEGALVRAPRSRCTRSDSPKAPSGLAAGSVNHAASMSPNATSVAPTDGTEANAPMSGGHPAKGLIVVGEQTAFAGPRPDGCGHDRAFPAAFLSWLVHRGAPILLGVDRRGAHTPYVA